MSNIAMRPTTILAGVLAAMLITSLPAGPVAAESLWSSSGSPSLYSDHQAHGVGDIVTIIISENLSAARTDANTNSKTTSQNMNAGTGIFSGLTSASAGNSDSFKAAGQITNSNTVTGQMSAVITGVKPNGDLLITGTQVIKQGGDQQTITVTGEIRPDDITSDNTILSSLVANAQIHIDGKGPLAGKQRQGLITQAFDFLF